MVEENNYNNSKIKVYSTKPILESGKYIIKDFNGEILKVVAHTEHPYHNVRLKLSSADGENICDFSLDEKISRQYPKNKILLTQEQIHLENYYIAGILYLEVEALGDRESIQMVSIYYK